MSMLPGSSSLKVVGSRKEGTTWACRRERCAKVAKRRKGQKSTSCTTALRGKKYGIKSPRRRDSANRKAKHQGEDGKEVIFNGEEMGIREGQKLETRSRKPSGPHCARWLTARTAGMASVRWSVVQLDHDGELGPMRECFGPIEAGIEVQRTINRADMTALCVVLSGLHR